MANELAACCIFYKFFYHYVYHYNVEVYHQLVWSTGHGVVNGVVRPLVHYIVCLLQHQAEEVTGLLYLMN